MKHVKAILRSTAGTNDRSSYKMDNEVDKVHYDGPFLIGSHTLCGMTDIVGYKFKITNKAVNCVGCIATKNHVMGR